MAPHSSTLAWKIPWTEEPGGLQSMRSQRVGHDWATSLSLFTFMHWRRKWQPTPGFLPGESQGWGSLWAAVYGVAQSRTRLKRLSSSSSSSSSSHRHRRRCDCSHRFDPWVEKIPWKRKWQPTPVFLPGKSQGQRSLVGYSPWGYKELDTMEQLTHTHTHTPLNKISSYPPVLVHSSSYKKNTIDQVSYK